MGIPSVAFSKCRGLRGLTALQCLASAPLGQGLEDLSRALVSRIDWTRDMHGERTARHDEEAAVFALEGEADDEAEETPWDAHQVVPEVDVVQ